MISPNHFRTLRAFAVSFLGFLFAVLLGFWAGVAVRGQTGADISRKPQFRARPGFSVEEVYSPEKSGSVVAMTFDSQGRLVISREKGPVVALLDTDHDGLPDREQIFTDKVTNCQGICFDGNDLFAVGQGPDGPGLYRVTDQDGDGKGDTVTILGRFTGEMGEHGPHAVFFGPDGLLHVVLGNHTGLVVTPDPYSPLKDYVEGYLLSRFTDPRGHAVNIRSPGGTIVRLDREANRWQLFAGGYRNTYDAAFNVMGELFTLDSDMEWDINLPWYRPVRTHHVVAGGDYGWRTGSEVWPPYYVDSLPSMTDVGRGSPTGLTFYQHTAYPKEYYDSFLQGDWSRGRILVSFPKKSGATYAEKSEEFLLGEPLNVTDLEVGPDGFLYFTKGGRFTEGGVYRVAYRPETGEQVSGVGRRGKAGGRGPGVGGRGKTSQKPLKVAGTQTQKPDTGNPTPDTPPSHLSPIPHPPSPNQPPTPNPQPPAPSPQPLIEQALAQPQPRSSWGRARLRSIQAQMGIDWEKALMEEVKNTSSQPDRRVRALELLAVYGTDAQSSRKSGFYSDFPSEEFLAWLGSDPQWEVRAASTYYLGMHPADSARRELARRLRDSDWFVQRRACEALVRTEIHPGMNPPFSPARDIFPLLENPDRFLRYAARQVLRRTNRNLWRDEAFKLDKYPAVTEALLALVQTVTGTHDVPDLLDREAELVKAKPSDDNLLGLLRVIDLTIINDEGVDYSAKYVTLGELLLPRFPSSSQSLNRELARTMARLETSGALEKVLQQLSSPQADRQQQIFYAYCLRAMQNGWDAKRRDVFIQWFEKTQEEHWKGGASFLGYIEDMWNDFLKQVPAQEKQAAMDRIPSLSPETAPPGEKPKRAFRRAKENQILSDQELSEFLLWDPMSYAGNIEAGKKSFEKAYCVNCHKFGDIGKEAGPDLTDVGKRFTRKDLVESIIYPSKTISDQYPAIEIVTKDDQSTVGIIKREDSKSIIMITAEGNQVTIPKPEIKSRRISKTSLMPDGLLDNLSPEETTDLFAFLEQRTKKTKEKIKQEEERKEQKRKKEEKKTEK
jgi:putative membrane-bound dehydrogenase-like protein